MNACTWSLFVDVPVLFLFLYRPIPSPPLLRVSCPSSTEVHFLRVHFALASFLLTCTDTMTLPFPFPLALSSSSFALPVQKGGHRVVSPDFLLLQLKGLMRSLRSSSLSIHARRSLTALQVRWLPLEENPPRLSYIPSCSLSLFPPSRTAGPQSQSLR